MGKIYHTFLWISVSLLKGLQLSVTLTVQVGNCQKMKSTSMHCLSTEHIRTFSSAENAIKGQVFGLLVNKSVKIPTSHSRVTRLWLPILVSH